MIENLFYVKKVIRNHQDLELYDALKQHPHKNLANVMDYTYNYNKTIVIEEFINGCTLDYQISQRKLYAKEVESIMLQLFSVIIHIHNLNPPIIHRDIKPENILIYHGHITLIDFEISKLLYADCMDILKRGSLGYAAPEQYHGKSTQQSDIYALGILLKEIIEASEERNQIEKVLHHVVNISTQLDISKRYFCVEDMKKDFLQSFHHKKW